MRASSPSVGRSSSSRAANGTRASDSMPRARSTRSSGGVLLGVTEQRRLADAGLADEREHRAVPGTGRREQSVELPPLSITPEQHARF